MSVRSWPVMDAAPGAIARDREVPATVLRFGPSLIRPDHPMTFVAGAHYRVLLVTHHSAPSY